MRRQLGRDERAQEQRLRELHLPGHREPDHRGDRAVATPLTEERLLELAVRALEGVVVPVEAAARLGGRDEEPEEDGAEERVVLGRTRARVGLREDRGSGLAPQLLEGEQRVLARAQHRFALLDERAHEWSQLVERGPGALDVLLERERQLRALLEVPPEHDEGAEGEATEERVQMRRAHGHRFPLRGGPGSPLSAPTGRDELRIVNSRMRARAAVLGRPPNS